jgi:oxalate decarboxylase
MFKSSYYADLSLDQWMALIPPELLKVHLNLDQQVTNALSKTKVPIRPA